MRDTYIVCWRAESGKVRRSADTFDWWSSAALAASRMCKVGIQAWVETLERYGRRDDAEDKDAVLHWLRDEQRKESARRLLELNHLVKALMNGGAAGDMPYPRLLRGGLFKRDDAGNYLVTDAGCRLADEFMARLAGECSTERP